MTVKLDPADFETRSLGSLELEMRRQIQHGRGRIIAENVELLSKLIGQRQTEAIMIVLRATGETVSESRSTLIHHGWDTTKAIRFLNRSQERQSPAQF